MIVTELIQAFDDERNEIISYPSEWLVQNEEEILTASCALAVVVVGRASES
jgi:hypothetical protein